MENRLKEPAEKVFQILINILLSISFVTLAAQLVINALIMHATTSLVIPYALAIIFNVAGPAILATGFFLSAIYNLVMALKTGNRFRYVDALSSLVCSLISAAILTIGILIPAATVAIITLSSVGLLTLGVTAYANNSLNHQQVKAKANNLPDYRKQERAQIIADDTRPTVPIFVRDVSQNGQSEETKTIEETRSKSARTNERFGQLLSSRGVPKNKKAPIPLLVSILQTEEHQEALLQYLLDNYSREFYQARPFPSVIATTAEFDQMLTVLSNEKYLPTAESYAEVEERFSACRAFISTLIGRDTNNDSNDVPLRTIFKNRMPAILAMYQKNRRHDFCKELSDAGIQHSDFIQSSKELIKFLDMIEEKKRIELILHWIHQEKMVLFVGSDSPKGAKPLFPYPYQDTNLPSFLKLVTGIVSNMPAIYAAQSYLIENSQQPLGQENLLRGVIDFYAKIAMRKEMELPSKIPRDLEEERHISLRA